MSRSGHASLVADVRAAIGLARHFDLCGLCGESWAGLAACLASQSSSSCRSGHTSSSHVKDVWRSWGHSLVIAWCCRWCGVLSHVKDVPWFQKRRKATVMLVEQSGNLPVVSWPFQLRYRRGYCDTSSSIELSWRQQLFLFSGGPHWSFVQSTFLLAWIRQRRQWRLLGEALTRLAIVLKLRLFYCVGNIVLVVYMSVVAYYECQLYYLPNALAALDRL